MSELLSVRGLTVALPVGGVKAPVLRCVDLSLQRGEFVGLVGESGSGKTLTALSILRLLPPRAEILGGRVDYAGQDLLRISEEQMRHIRGHDVAMVFQEPITALNPVLTVGYQIVEAMRAKGRGRNASRDEAIRLLDLVGIPASAESLEDYPHQLSGGQRQRVMIAMALAAEPEILIADEPTSALDVTVQAQILDLLEDLRSRLDLTILLITHDLSLVAEVCDRVMVMYAGQIVERLGASQLFESPAHPYTKGLVAAIPSLGVIGLDGGMPTLPGYAPDPSSLPKGCSFHPRCAEVLPDCGTVEPSLLFVDSDQDARCILFEPGKTSEEGR